jgi:hypothetical protein
MSWFSRAENAFINLVTGKPANLNIILNPTTPVEQAVNGAAAVILPLAAALPGAAYAASTASSIQAVVNGVEGVPVAPAAAAQASTALGGLTTTLGTQAAIAANKYLSEQVGTSNTQLADAGLEALAAAAITMMSTSKSVAVEDIATSLSGLVQGFAAQSAASAAAPAKS